MRLLKRLLSGLIVWRYSRWGLDWAEWEQFAPDHEANPCTKAFRRWEKLYEWVGYYPLLRYDWVEAHLGELDYKQFLRQDRDGYLALVLKNEIKKEVDAIILKSLIELACKPSEPVASIP